MKQRNILVVENQRTQYKNITDKLGGRYNIYPAQDEYVFFVDHVRICLNNRYSPNRINQSFEYIKESITSNNIELLIIDHILVGCHTGDTGIDLVERLRATNGVKTIPVIFLSRTPANDKTVKDRFYKIENAVWVEKGYAGMRILDKEYFKPHVLDLIEVRLGKSEHDIYIEIIEKLKQAEMLKGHLHVLEEILSSNKNETSFAAEDKEFLDQLNDCLTTGFRLTQAKLNSFISSYATNRKQK